MTLPPAARVGATLALAAAAGWAAQSLRVPLPWLIGPLFTTAACSVVGWRVAASQRLRNAGQWAIGVTLGLYFTPEVGAQLRVLAPWLVLGAAWALFAGWAFHRFLRWRHPDEPPAATFFAAAIGGASEMAVLAERHGAPVDRVASAHSLRLMIVVVALPFGLQAAGVAGVDAAVPLTREVRPGGLALLVALSLAGVLALHRLALPNPFVLGALAVTLGLSLGGVVLSALPPAVTAAGQLFIGVALGARFTPEFVHSAPRWLASVAIGTLGLLATAGAVGVALAAAAGLHPATGLLAQSPGGIAEMCITAQVLRLGVPVVTAFHLLRYVAVLTLTPLLFRWETRA